MQPDTSRVWTRSEVRTTVGKILVESLGVDEDRVTDDASLIRDLGAESIDFLDISFRCQQAFGVDLPARLIQDRVLAWRDLSVLSSVVGARHGIEVPAEELRTVTPATVAAVLAHLEAKHGVARAPGDEAALALALAERLLAELDGTGLDLGDVAATTLAEYLGESLHSPAAIDTVMDRFTVRALSGHIVDHLGRASRVAAGA